MRRENCKVDMKCKLTEKGEQDKCDCDFCCELKNVGYFTVLSISETTCECKCGEFESDIAIEVMEPYIEHEHEPKQEPVDNRPNFFNPNVSDTCNCFSSREKECKFFIKHDAVSICRNRVYDEVNNDSCCHSPEAHADYYSRNPKKEESKEPENEIEKLKAEKQELRIELEKQIALNVWKDEEVNKLRSTNGSLLAVIKKKNSIIANCLKVADKDAKEFSELKDKNEKLKDRIFNLSLEIVSDKEEIKQLETVINYYERKRNEKIRK